MKNCILCNKPNLKKVIDYGHIYPSAFIDKDNQIDKAELALNYCEACDFMQLTQVLPPDSMYREYWYRSGTNASMVQSLHDIVKYGMLFYQTHNNAYGMKGRVLDIGCNDGTLLNMYPTSWFKVGFDPANNLADSASKKCNLFINNYFNDSVYFDEKFDIITSIAMFYDLQDPHSFIETIKRNLAKNGIWIIQMTDVEGMFSTYAFDNICHEHLAYYTLYSLKNLMEQHGLEIINVSYNRVNGSSLRATVSFKNNFVVHQSVKTYLQIEQEEKTLDKVIRFNRKISDIKIQLKEMMKDIKIFGIGASTKGNTLLQVFDISNENIPYILEVSKNKIGKYTAGSNIPIISEEEGFSKDPEALLVLPWHFIDNFKIKYSNYLSSGGRFLVPLPQPKFIHACSSR